MKQFPQAPTEILKSLLKNRGLLYALVVREIAGRYRGSVLGILWSLLNPIIMITIYTFVFSVVLKAKWGTETGSNIEFGLLLFAGLLVFNFFAECFTRAPTAIVANINFVKKVVFPIEILPLVLVLSALFHLLIGLVVWILIYAINFGWPHPSIAWIPIVIIPLVLLTLAFSWTLAAFGVYFRDIVQVSGTVTTGLLFLSPIFYPTTALPESFQYLIHFNPLTPAIELLRDVMYRGIQPDVYYLASYSGASIAFASIGFIIFQGMRRGFADVL